MVLGTSSCSLNPSTTDAAALANMASNGRSGCVFELPGEPIIEASTTSPPTTAVGGINLNGMCTSFLRPFLFAVRVS